MKTHTIPTGAGLFLSILLLAPAVAQSPAPSTGTVFHVETRRVLEDITVSDSQGRPIQGLTQADFRIFEDGVEQQIASFEEHRQDASTAPPPPALPPNTFSNLPDPRLPDRSTSSFMTC